MYYTLIMQNNIVFSWSQRSVYKFKKNYMYIHTHTHRLNVQIKNERKSCFIWKICKRNCAAAFQTLRFVCLRTFLRDLRSVKQQHSTKGMPDVGKYWKYLSLSHICSSICSHNRSSSARSTCLKRHLQRFQQLSSVWLKWWTGAASLRLFAEFVTEPGDARGRRKHGWYRQQMRVIWMQSWAFLIARGQQRELAGCFFFSKEQSISSL